MTSSARGKAVGLIPARLESSRLPRKALVDICGLPMIVHVYRRSAMAELLDDVYVATDSEEIRRVVLEHGGKVLMTGTHHETGTDRIAEAVAGLECDIVVNIQGDEALVRPEHIDAGVRELRRDPTVHVTILVTPYRKYGVASDIKVVVNERNDVLYLSRADIPSDVRTLNPDRLKGYHVLAFRKPFLLEYSRWPRGRLEIIEFHEHLRILERGERIRAVHVDSDAISIDTSDDLACVRERMPADRLFMLYHTVEGSAVMKEDTR